MIPAIKSEFRKLLTTRTTYVIIGLALLINTFFSFWVEGFRANPASLHNPLKLAGEATSAVDAVSIFGAIIAILLFANEYRYNTIMYTLTASSRSKVLAAKFIVTSVFAVLFTAFMGLFSPVMTHLGLSAHHLQLVPQTINVGDLLWRCLFVGWAYSMLGLLFAALLRNQVAAIVAFFVLPSTVENLLGLLLKENVVYLPFSALNAVLQHSEKGSISYGKAALVGLTYLIVGWIVAWILFRRRDAN